MKAKIIISGGIQSSFEISRGLNRYTKKKDEFNNMIFFYAKVGDARLDLENSYRRLKEVDGGDSNLRLERVWSEGSVLHYDAAVAKVLKQ